MSRSSSPVIDLQQPLRVSNSSTDGTAPRVYKFGLQITHHKHS